MVEGEYKWVGEWTSLVVIVGFRPFAGPPVIGADGTRREHAQYRQFPGDNLCAVFVEPFKQWMACLGPHFGIGRVDFHEGHETIGEHGYHERHPHRDEERIKRVFPFSEGHNIEGCYEGSFGKVVIIQRLALRGTGSAFRTSGG